MSSLRPIFSSYPVLIPARSLPIVESTETIYSFNSLADPNSPVSSTAVAAAESCHLCVDLPEKAEQFLCHRGASPTATDLPEKIFSDCDFTENCNQNCFVLPWIYKLAYRPCGAKPNENGKSAPAMTVAACSEDGGQESDGNIFRKKSATVSELSVKNRRHRARETYKRHWLRR